MPEGIVPLGTILFGIAAFGAAPHIASGIAGATPHPPGGGVHIGGVGITPSTPPQIGTAGTIITQQLLAILGILLTPHIFLTPLFDNISS